VTPDINVVLFNEASVRIFHELSKQDIIYIDATGKLFANEQNYPSLLYYAMVLRNPYRLNAPIPISELISSRHNAESIGLMIRKLKEREKDVFKSKNVVSSWR
jgi:flagellar biosynthesis regulator FlbT